VVEVSHIDTRGLWLFVDGTEHHMSFEDFPWFAEATVKQISQVERHGVDHMHWPELDVDLTLDMIDHPEKYPLTYRS
jgi:hypothetical protein